MVPMSSSSLGELFKLKKCVAIAMFQSDAVSNSPIVRFGKDIIDLPHSSL